MFLHEGRVDFYCLGNCSIGNRITQKELFKGKIEMKAARKSIHLYSETPRAPTHLHFHTVNLLLSQ